MPHLDAKALVDDKVGMTFLARVLDAPAEPALPENSGPATSGETVGEATVGRPIRRRRRTLDLIPEAA